MQLWLWLLYFLPVSGALRFLPEVKLEGILGGSITIECPLPESHVRIYLCREMPDSRICATVVSNQNFVRKGYKRRVTLTTCPNKNVYLVEVTGLVKSDSGIYACGAGVNTDRGKTQQVTLSVHSEYAPFLEDKLMTEPPEWFHEFQHVPMTPSFQMPAHSSSAEFISKVTTPAQRTKVPPAPSLSPISTTTHHPRVSRTSSVAGAKSPTLLPSTKALKTSAQKGPLKSQTASHIHHPRQRDFHYGQTSGAETQRFNILIPTTLSLTLLAPLGLVVRRVIQRRKSLARRVSRPTLRMRVPEASRLRQPQRPRDAQRPRCQNIYSACPRRASGADSAALDHFITSASLLPLVKLEVLLPGPGASAPLTPQQVSVTSWCHAPTLKTSDGCVSTHHQPACEAEDTDPEDYVNIHF
ncbi:PREDICTED: fas apoptotic inhibitory molecule 3 [Condylura cristata]|uniref:fas apoptotic inhibitory molecule 3 n=1 Tax=Condylura cristata TaxID=143302 RepID=UPI000642BA6F|nr:PREDICTED: fas apoptotic inhibitory molecule 3 [Condylura cristata]